MVARLARCLEKRFKSTFLATCLRRLRGSFIVEGHRDRLRRWMQDETYVEGGLSEAEMFQKAGCPERVTAKRASARSGDLWHVHSKNMTVYYDNCSCAVSHSNSDRC